MRPRLLLIREQVDADSTIYWSQIEITVAMICACMLCIKPLITQYIAPYWPWHTSKIHEIARPGDFVTTIGGGNAGLRGRSPPQIHSPNITLLSVGWGREIVEQDEEVRTEGLGEKWFDFHSSVEVPFYLQPEKSGYGGPVEKRVYSTETSTETSSSEKQAYSTSTQASSPKKPPIDLHKPLPIPK